MKRISCILHPVSCILAAFITLGWLYSVTAPILESPDELWHYEYIKHLADGRGLPVQPTDDRKQESHQPPLYYLLGASLTWWINTDDLPTLQWRNPHWGYPSLGIENDNKNQYVHTDREDFPYRGAALAIHLLRAITVLLGAIPVLVTYLIARRVLPRQPVLALGAAALVAFNPQYLFLSASVNNDIPVTVLFALGMWLALGLLWGQTSTRRLVLLGVLCGLALLTKWSGLALIPLALLPLVVAAWRARSWRLLLVGGFCIGVLPFLLAGPWFLRNWTLYGDLLGMNRYLEIWEPRVPSPTLWQIFTELPEKSKSFWATFGWGHIHLAGPIYTGLDLLMGLALLGLIVLLVRSTIRWSRAFRRAVPAKASTPNLSYDRFSLFLLALWFAAVFVSFLRWMFLTEAAWGRHLFPALPAIGVLLILGLSQLVPHRLYGLLVALVGGGLFALALACPFAYILPAYARPPAVPTAEINALQPRVNVTYGDAIELLAVEPAETTVRPGDRLHLTLYLRGLRPISQDYSLYVHLAGRDDQPLGHRDTYPGLGTYPTSLWTPGIVIRDRCIVPITVTATAPAACRIEVGFYDSATMENLPAHDAAGQPVGRPLVGLVKLAAREPQPYTPTYATRLDLGGKVTLVGYDLPTAVASPGQTVPLTLTWRCLAPLGADYTVFVHLLGPDGRAVAQADGPPLRGDYPTSLWAAGETLPDPRPLTLPAGMSPGTYTIAVGLYRPDTWDRLPVTDASGTPVPAAQCILPTPIEVRP